MAKRSWQMKRVKVTVCWSVEEKSTHHIMKYGRS